MSVAKVLGPDAGKAGMLGSIGVRFMVAGADSGEGSRWSSIQCRHENLQPHSTATAREDEYSFVLEGRVGALLGDEVVWPDRRPDLQTARPMAHLLECW